MLSLNTPVEVLEREFGPGGLIEYRALLEKREAKKPIIEAEFTEITAPDPEPEGKFSNDVRATSAPKEDVAPVLPLPIEKNSELFPALAEDDDGDLM